MKIYVKSAKQYVARPLDRFKSMVGVSDYGLNSAKLKEVHLSDYGANSRYNYCIYDPYYDLSPEDIQTYTKRLKELGAKYITKRRGALYFYYDLSKLNADYEADKKAAEDAYTAELNAKDIDIYKPDAATIKKLIAYRDKGSRVNVKAIKDMDKLLKYYYGAFLIGWMDLAGDIEEVLRFKGDEDLLKAIERRVQSNEEYSDGRTEMEKKLELPDSKNLFTFEEKNCWLPKAILMYFINSDIPVHFGKRTSGAQYDRNGREWSEIEHLTLFPDSEAPIKYDIVVHTNEGGGAKRYTGSNTVERGSARDVLEGLARVIR